jgi:hypothetical protein
MSFLHVNRLSPRDCKVGVRHVTFEAEAVSWIRELELLYSTQPVQLYRVCPYYLLKFVIVSSGSSTPLSLQSNIDLSSFFLPVIVVVVSSPAFYLSRRVVSSVQRSHVLLLRVLSPHLGRASFWSLGIFRPFMSHMSTSLWYFLRSYFSSSNKYPERLFRLHVIILCGKFWEFMSSARHP